MLDLVDPPTSRPPRIDILPGAPDALSPVPNNNEPDDPPKDDPLRISMEPDPDPDPLTLVPVPLLPANDDNDDEDEVTKRMYELASIDTEPPCCDDGSVDNPANIDTEPPTDPDPALMVTDPPTPSAVGGPMLEPPWMSKLPGIPEVVLPVATLIDPVD